MLHESMGVPRGRFRFLFLMAVGLCLPCAFEAAAAEQYDVITPFGSGNDFGWRIDRPNVRQHQTDYRNIRFQAGDLVTVLAGGGVQTGGVGLTWKRYVNPLGPDSDRYYSGLLWIPGVTAGLVRISTVIGRPHQIPANLPPTAVANLYLRLGYEDDNYSDNGYWGHDNGTQDQCRNMGPAFVTIRVQRGVQGPNVPVLPLDLVWDTLEDNLLPLNPMWGWQKGHDPASPIYYPEPFSIAPQLHHGPPGDPPPVLSAVTSQGVDYDSSDFFGYHVNWGAATVHGLIKWGSHSPPGTDDDYNMDIYPPGGAGVTHGRKEPVIEIEFDTDETIDHFQTPWWDAFHQAVDKGPDLANWLSGELHLGGLHPGDGGAAARAMIDGKEAIATGLVGLDCAHTAESELHPVWALAIHVKEDPSDDVWAMFVRNWGNEGFCSNKQHYLSLPSNSPGRFTFTFRLPWWRGGARSCSPLGTTRFLTNSNQATGPMLTPVTNQGVLVAFVLPQPEAGARFNGELHLRWDGANPAPPAISLLHGKLPPARGVKFPPMVAAVGVGEADKPEMEFIEHVQKIPLDRRAKFVAAIKPLLPKVPVHDQVAMAAPQMAVALHAMPLRTAGPALPPLRQASAPDPAHMMRYQQLGRALLDALGPETKTLFLDVLRKHVLQPPLQPVAPKAGSPGFQFPVAPPGK